MHLGQPGLANLTKPLSTGFVWDSYGLILGLITLIICIVCLMASFHSSTNRKIYILRFNAISLISIWVFFRASFLIFYVRFELRLLPITLLVIGWGYQPERLKASYALILYTIFSSLPLLILIIKLGIGGNFNFLATQNAQMLADSTSNFIFSIICLRAFLVKLPMFLTHMWLPKAHVEAPVAGSMFLAAVLLKLGGIGLIRVSPLVTLRTYIIIIFTISSAALIWVGTTCIFLRDIKIIIAYSSVAHIALGLMARLRLQIESISTIILILLTHGVSSSFIFIQRFYIYTRSNSRRVLLTHSSLWWSGLFSRIWFISCIGILGAPPRANILAEVKCIIDIVSFSYFSLIFLIPGALLAGGYSIALFSFVYHTKYSKLNNLNSFSLREANTSFLHLIWLVRLTVRIFWVIY